MSTKQINELALDFKAELVSNLERENKVLHKQVQELKHQLAQRTLGHHMTPEELVCIEQIGILHNRSSQRELSLEEVKKLDLLIKNLRLIKEQSTENVANAQWRDVSEDALVAIASKSES